MILNRLVNISYSIGIFILLGFETNAQNIAPNSSVSISSTFQAGNYTAGDLIDGDFTANDWSTGWYANFFNSSNPQSAEFDFGVGNTATIGRYDLYGHSDASVRPPGHRFEARNTTSESWVILNTVSTKIGSGLNSHNISNTTAYRYYRIIMTDNGGASGTAGFQEVEFFGTFTLPVDLIDFKVESLNDHTAELSWWTASEWANDFFVIERSEEGMEWTIIDTVYGEGYTNDLQEYHYTDHPQEKGKLYYRLQQVDIDGSTSYSPVRMIVFSGRKVLDIEVFPNPAELNSTVNVVVGEVVSSIQLVDCFGKMNMDYIPYTDYQGQIKIDLSDLSIAEGVYFLKFDTKYGTMLKSIYLISK